MSVPNEDGGALQTIRPTLPKAAQSSAGLELSFEPANEEHRMSEVRVDGRLFASGGMDLLSIVIGLPTEFSGRDKGTWDGPIIRHSAAGPVVAGSPREKTPRVVHVGPPGVVAHLRTSAGAFVALERRAEIVVGPCRVG